MRECGEIDAGEGEQQQQDGFRLLIEQHLGARRGRAEKAIKKTTSTTTNGSNLVLLAFSCSLLPTHWNHSPRPSLIRAQGCPLLAHPRSALSDAKSCRCEICQAFSPARDDTTPRPSALSLYYCPLSDIHAIIDVLRICDRSSSMRPR